ncbi:Spy/CpxP family protein refolding chaperone [Glaciimonas sp. PAMC28666]|nr:Spy/CpxP family protein refolding chaperone [Glaciimonas sp. PAMC28666]
MVKLRKQLLIGITAIGISAMGMTAFAQNTTGGAPAVEKAIAQSDNAPMHQPPTAEQRAKFEARMAKREAKLHTALKITPAQEGAWKTYISQMRPNRSAMPMQRPTKEEWAKQTAPERMDHRIEFMKKMEARMSDRAAALKQFYAVLTPDQQKILDKHFIHEHRGHRGPWGGQRGM